MNPTAQHFAARVQTRTGGCNRRRPRAVSQRLAVQRRISPPQRRRCEQALPGVEGPRSQAPPPGSRLPRPPTGFLKTSFQRRGLAESWGQPQGWSSKNKTNLFRSPLGRS